MNRLFHPIKKEFRKEKCNFDYSADVFVKSQWQQRSKSVTYLIYRWVIAIFFTAVVIESMFDPDDGDEFWLYFIYMTDWGIMMCMATNLLGAILVTIWHFHPEYEDKLLNMESLSSPFRIYWAMHIITLVLSIVITTIYWSILYDATEDGLTVTNIATHACNSLLMFIDLLIVAHPLRLVHVFLPLIFGFVYTIFSVIYQCLGGHNKKGKPYIYHVIDWRQPISATCVCLGVYTLVCVVYFCLFLIYKLRLLIYRRLHNSSFILPTRTSLELSRGVKNGHASSGMSKTSSVAPSAGIQHAPSGISMVLGSYAGYENEAYAGSKASKGSAGSKVAKY